MAFYPPRQQMNQRNNYQMTPRTPAYYDNRGDCETLPGKLINNLNDIRPQNIPYDGTVAWFPASDYSCVFAKGWSDSGDRIDTIKYVPEQRANQEQQVSPEMQLLQAIIQRQDRIEQMLLGSGLFEDEKKSNIFDETKSEEKQ